MGMHVLQVDLQQTLLFDWICHQEGTKIRLALELHKRNKEIYLQWTRMGPSLSLIKDLSLVRNTSSVLGEVGTPKSGHEVYHQ